VTAQVVGPSAIERSRTGLVSLSHYALGLPLAFVLTLAGMGVLDACEDNRPNGCRHAGRLASTFSALLQGDPTACAALGPP